MMDLKTMALSMLPFWLLGLFVVVMTILAGQKNVLRIEKPAIKKWLEFLLTLTIYRFVLFKLFPHFSLFTEAQKNISTIPWQLTLLVFWEDATHSLPLFFLKRWIGERKWLKPLYFACLALVMVEFGLSHLYQGLGACLLLSFYIPYSIKAGEKYGFGTTMVAHTLFDLVTVLTLKML
jgi:hypothetical protein